MSALLFAEKIRRPAKGVLLDCIHGLEAFQAHIDGVYQRNLCLLNPVTLSAASGLERIGTVLWFLYALYATKYREFLGNSIRATHDEDFLIFAHCGRGLIEATANLRYYNNKVLSVVLAAKDPDAFSPQELEAIDGL